MYLSLLGIALVSTLSNAQTFSLVKDYSGQNFLSGFNYYQNATDRNNGNVHFISQDNANSRTDKLTYVDSNNNIIIKVDNTTVDQHAGEPFDNFGRDTVYLMSNDKIKLGSLLILDANHIPWGCSVWPGFFTQGENWPDQGEIDIIENVNLAPTNQYALHTGLTPCNLPQSSNQTGHAASSGLNCTLQVTPKAVINPSGCIVVENQQNSYGDAFAKNNGGVYAMLWNEEGVKIWFFPRGAIPSDISATGNSPNPTSWSTPSAYYPASDCNPSKAFGDQIITIEIDICGDFAAGVFSDTCGNVAPNCSALVGDPKNYNNAYWNITYLKVFSQNSNSSGSSSGGSNNSTGSNSNGSGNNNSTGSGSGGSGSKAQSVIAVVPTTLTAFAVTLALVTWALIQ